MQDKPCKKAEISIPFGEGEVGFRLEGVRLIGRYGLVVPETVPDVEGTIRAAMEEPVGSPRLKDIARGKKRVAVISDDATRPTPVALILPYVLAELEEAGIKDDSITIVMANGSHRKMTIDEIEGKLGCGIAARYAIDNHDYKAADLVDMGHTPSGVPVMLNRTVAEADLTIGIGSIVPHRYCGWSGGAKIVQPGVCGEDTTVATHLMITKDPEVRLGNVENVVRREMEEVAKKANLRFIVNVVLDGAGRPVAAVAGDPRLAHRKGVALATDITAARIPKRADMVICGSHPADMNLWQAGKAFYTADLAVRDKGTVILVTPAYEGIGEHPEFGRLLTVQYAEILNMLDEGLIEDRLGAAAALAVRLVAERARIVVITDGLAGDEVRAMGFTHYPVAKLQEAIEAEAALLASGGRIPEVTVLAEAPDMLPLIAY